MQGVTRLEVDAAKSVFLLGKHVGWVQATGFWGIVSAVVGVISWM